MESRTKPAHASKAQAARAAPEARQGGNAAEAKGATVTQPEAYDPATDGELFNVATYGRLTMPAYRFQISPADRWAIVAYVRALQRAGHGAIEDVPSELRWRVR